MHTEVLLLNPHGILLWVQDNDRYLLGEYLLAYLGRSVTKLKSFDAGGAESHLPNLLDIWQRYLLECLGEVKPSSPDLLDQW